MLLAAHGDGNTVIAATSAQFGGMGLGVLLWAEPGAPYSYCFSKLHDTKA